MPSILTTRCREGSHELCERNGKRMASPDGGTLVCDCQCPCHRTFHEEEMYDDEVQVTERRYEKEIGRT